MGNDDVIQANAVAVMVREQEANLIVIGQLRQFNDLVCPRFVCFCSAP